MTVFSSPIKRALAASFFLAAASAGAHADNPTPAALEAAHTVILASGLTRSFDVIVPESFGEMERSVILSRPELKDALHATLLALLPEFTKTEQDVINNAAAILAKHMSEQELKDTANFFTSPSGKKYVDAQPAAFPEIIKLAQEWRQRLSTDVLTRTREEMKKKGLDF